MYTYNLFNQICASKMCLEIRLVCTFYGCKRLDDEDNKNAVLLFVFIQYSCIKCNMS